LFNVTSFCTFATHNDHMSKTVKTSYTDIEFRQLIRDEVHAVLSTIPGMPKVEVNEGYLTVSQAADTIKLKIGTIYNLVNRNKIPFHKSGKRLLFKRSELVNWLLLGDQAAGEY
jgi:excisionase family DNA binding protein